MFMTMDEAVNKGYGKIVYRADSWDITLGQNWFIPNKTVLVVVTYDYYLGKKVAPDAVGVFSPGTDIPLSKYYQHVYICPVN